MIDANQIEEVKSLKYLGLHVECLDWKRHCNGVSSSENSWRHLIRRFKNVLNEKQLIMLYHAQAQSHLRNCLVFWRSSFKFKDVFVTQRKVIRSIAGVPQITTCESYFEKHLIITMFAYSWSLCFHSFKFTNSKQTIKFME